MEIINFVCEEFTLPKANRQTAFQRMVFPNENYGWTIQTYQTKPSELHLFSDRINAEYLFTEFTDWGDNGVFIPKQTATYTGPLSILGMVDGYTAVPVEGIISVQPNASVSLTYIEYLAEMSKISNIPHLPTFAQIDVVGQDYQITDLKEYVKKLKTIVQDHRSNIEILKRKAMGEKLEIISGHRILSPTKQQR